MGKALLVAAGCAAAFLSGMCFGVWAATFEIVERLSDDEIHRLIGDGVVGTVVKAAAGLVHHG